jgi:WD40 repeat protein
LRDYLDTAFRSLDNSKTPFEWNYLNRLCLLEKNQIPQKTLLPLYGNAVALSPDKQTMATIGLLHGEILLYDMAKETTRGTLTGHEGGTHALAFSSDSQTLVSAGADKTVKVWDATLKEKKALKTLTGHEGPVLAVAISKDGARIASASADKTARIWDVKDAKELFKLAEHTDAVQALVFGADDKSVITGGADRRILVWDASSGKRTAELSGQAGPVAALALSRDGKKLASGGSDFVAGTEAGLIRQWDIASAKTEGPTMVHGVAVTALVYGVAQSRGAEEAILLSGGKDGLIRAWDANSGKQKAVQHGHRLALAGLAISSDGKSSLASVGKDQTARLWDLPSLLQGDALPHDDWVCSVAFSKNNKVLVSAGRDGAIKFWDVATGRPLSATIEKANGAVASLSLHSEGDAWKLAAGIATSDGGGEIRIWEVKAGDSITTKLLHTLKDKDHASGITAVAFAPNGKRLASASFDKNALVWNVETGKVEHRLEGHKAAVRCLAWDLPGKSLASGSDDKTIRIWDPEKGKETALLERGGHQGAVTTLAFLPEPQGASIGQQRIPIELISGGDDKTLRYWSVVAKLAVDQPFQGHGGGVTCVACRSGGLIVSASWDHLVKSWLTSGEDNFTFAGHTGPVRAVAISPDGLTLASASHDGTVRLWRSTPPRLAPKKARDVDFGD